MAGAGIRHQARRYLSGLMQLRDDAAEARDQRSAGAFRTVYIEIVERLLASSFIADAWTARVERILGRFGGFLKAASGGVNMLPRGPSML